MISNSARFFFLSLFLFSFFISISFPSLANAAIVPCGRSEDDPATANINESKPCTICHLVIGGNKIIEWGLKVMTYVAIAVIVAMAILYIVSTGNEGLMKTAKGGLMAALAGFAIMLGAWLIVMTTLRIIASKPDPSDPSNPSKRIVVIPGLVVSKTGFGFTCDTTSLAGTATGGSGGDDGGGLMCQNPDVYKQWVAKGGSVCAETCKMPADKRNEILSKKTNDGTTYGSIIDKYEGDRNIISAIIYQESKGNPNAHSSDGGCGLMQITNSAWIGSCPASILNPDENIKQGIALYKQKLQAVQGKSYGNGIMPKHLAFAAYNCCNNGEDPNAPSASCKTTDGWPSLPKWACPIEPGNGASNMCSVKSYACNVGACT